MEKKSIMRAFNNHIDELIDDLLIIYPKEAELYTIKTFCGTLKKVNPICMIKLWYNNITVNYKKQIEDADEEFFKNEKFDINKVKNKEYNMKKLERFFYIIQDALKEIDEDNKKKCFKYLQNLTKMSELYFN